jgi:hypothetical protein
MWVIICNLNINDYFISLSFSDQMKNKLQFNVDDLDKYTVEELRQQVDEAIGQVCKSKIVMTVTTVLLI